MSAIRPARHRRAVFLIAAASLAPGTASACLPPGMFEKAPGPARKAREAKQAIERAYAVIDAEVVRTGGYDEGPALLYATGSSRARGSVGSRSARTDATAAPASSGRWASGCGCSCSRTRRGCTWRTRSPTRSMKIGSCGRTGTSTSPIFPARDGSRPSASRPRRAWPRGPDRERWPAHAAGAPVQPSPTAGRLR